MRESPEIDKDNKDRASLEKNVGYSTFRNSGQINEKQLEEPSLTTSNSSKRNGDKESSGIKQKVCLSPTFFCCDEPSYLIALSCSIYTAAKVNKWRSDSDLPLPSFLTLLPRPWSVPTRDKGSDLATAKNSLGVYASLSPSRRRFRAELAWSWSLSPRITPAFSVDLSFGCLHFLGGPGFLLPPVRSSTEVRIKIFRIANYSVREAMFFSFVNSFFILKTHPVRIHCCNYNQIGIKSGQSSHMIRKFM